MSMKIQARTDAYGDITVYMEGGLDYQNSVFLKYRLEKIVSENPFSTITLDLYRLDFVGSSGIGFFAEIIKTMNSRKKQIRISNAKNEFVKVFKLFNLDIEDASADELEADKPSLPKSVNQFK